MKYIINILKTALSLIIFVLIGACMLLNPYWFFVMDTQPLWVLFTNPLGYAFALFAIGALVGIRYCRIQWFWLDVGICSLVYGTHRRTISGVTGQKMLHSNRKYWKVQGAIIDFLARLVGDDKDHCVRAYEWEKKHLKNLTNF